MSEQHEAVRRHDLTISKNGKRVWYNDRDSHAATHIKDAPQLVDLAAEVTQNTDLTGDYLLFHTDMGRIVGLSDLVTVDPGDKLVYAKRPNRDSYTVFNMDKPPQPSSLVTTTYELQDDGSYELVSTWIGPSDSPSFPGTERETPDSKAYWAAHALAWGTQEIQPDSATTDIPW